jgi:hypothetical protein
MDTKMYRKRTIFAKPQGYLGIDASPYPYSTFSAHQAIGKIIIP